MPTALPWLGGLSANQAKIGFMNQRSWLQRLPGLLLGKLGGSELPQFLVDQRKQLRRILWIGFILLRQGAPDVCHNWYSTHRWAAGEMGAPGRSLSSVIITTEANELMGEFHDRMPVILHPEDYDLWLDLDVKDPVLLEALLQPFPSDELEVYPVSRLVNDPKNEDPKCLERSG
jgi:hypothetical protein